MNAAEPPWTTTTLPLGLIEPLAEALAVIVQLGRISATAKSPKPVIPVACVLVAVRVPVVVEVQLGALYRRTMKLPVLAPASTSPDTNPNVAA